jgi:serine O-acetyltransferase
MGSRLRPAFQQISYLGEDIKRIVNRKRHRWISVWFTQCATAVIRYRFNRFIYLALGKYAKVYFTLVSPIAFMFRPWIGHSEINYEADIGSGLFILHPTFGVYVSQKVVAGKRLTLTGGNLIGSRRHPPPGTNWAADDFIARWGVAIGDDVMLGTNAVVLGPLTIGDNVKIGAGAVVVKGIASNEVVVGVPARPVNNRKILSEG